MPLRSYCPIAVNQQVPDKVAVRHIPATTLVYDTNVMLDEHSHDNTDIPVMPVIITGKISVGKTESCKLDLMVYKLLLILDAGRVNYRPAALRNEPRGIQHGDTGTGATEVLY
jgi:hypothetical protein